MAKIAQGILGGISGTIANIIGGSWKGINYIRSKPLSVANPRTAGQVAQRTKFAATVAVSKVLLASIIKPLWDRFAQRESGYNAFLSANIDAFNSAGFPTPTDMVMSEGTLQGVADLASSSGAATGEVEINWTDNSGTGFALATDEVYITFYDGGDNEFFGIATPATRSSATVTVALPFDIAEGDNYSTWISFKRVDGTIVSNSQISSGVIAV